MSKFDKHEDRIKRLNRKMEILTNESWSDVDKLEYMLLDIEPYSWYWRVGMKKALKRAIECLKKEENSH